MELLAYVKQVESDIIHQLDIKLQDAKDRLMFLLNYATIPLEDMKLNIKTFSWLGKMDSVIAGHKLIAEAKREEFQEALKVCFDRSSSFTF